MEQQRSMQQHMQHMQQQEIQRRQSQEKVLSGKLFEKSRFAHVYVRDSIKIIVQKQNTISFELTMK